MCVYVCVCTSIFIHIYIYAYVYVYIRIGIDRVHWDLQGVRFAVRRFIAASWGAGD